MRWSRRRPKKGQSLVILDPGLSFGTGQHPTTRFCLEQLVAARGRRNASSILDAGCGSGILAIAAAVLGYSRVEAFDFDAVAVRYAKRVNGLTSQAITKLDVLDDSAEINVCTAYRYRGKTYTEVPADRDILSQCEPVYETLPGWLSSTTGITSRSALPKLARRYLDRIEELTGCPIDLVSTGTKRRETIMIKHPLKTRSASGAGSPRRG